MYDKQGCILCTDRFAPSGARQRRLYTALTRIVHMTYSDCTWPLPTSGAAPCDLRVQIDFAGAESVGGWDLCKAYESVHEGQLSGIGPMTDDRIGSIAPALHYAGPLFWDVPAAVLKSRAPRRAALDPFRSIAAREADGRWACGSQAAPSTCRVGLLGCRRVAVGIGGLLPTHITDFGPDLKFLGPRSSMLCGSDVIAAEVEEVIDLIVG
jgi:hypothetical protein